MIGVAGILIALGLLMYLAFRGVTVLILGPAMAALAILIAGGLPILGAYTQVFMTSLGDFIIAYFPLFMLGAIFGKLMDDSGSAQAIARQIIAWLGPSRAILSVVLCCGALTYGGVSLFVVAFAIFPIAAALFRQADIPKRLIPASLALGAFTFTMSALPGTPAIQNAIPMPYFGTTAFAAPGLGIIAGLIMLGLGTAWINRRAGRARRAGEGYGEHEDALPKPDVTLRERAAPAENYDLREAERDTADAEAMPGFALAVTPVVLVILVNFLFVEFVVPAMDTGYLALPEFGATTIESVRGVWAIIVALLVSILVLIATNWSRLTALKTSLNRGADAAVLPIFNTASLVGFGAVVAALPAFELVREAVLSIGGGNPLISLAAAVNVLAAMTGSASGGMSIALESLGPVYVELARAEGIALEAMHRVTAVAAGTLDALPHNGAVITLLSICKLGHKDAYLDIFVVAIAIPLLALAVLIALATLFGTF
ncbi:MAG: GntP family permease [Alphaproteobacteria bacterium]|jgi:H+/gluconate symporter-like permease|nr:GntP family permease [Alphaproteobacteria bacterium]